MDVEYKETEKFTKEVIKEILIVNKESGLTAENLVEKAKSKKSSLHILFEWDNSIAAERWRVHTARLIINEVKILVGDKELYAFENISIMVESNGSGSFLREYKPIIEIMNNEDYKKQLVRKALQEILYWRQRHKELTEFRKIFSTIDDLTERLQKKK